MEIKLTPNDKRTILKALKKGIIETSDLSSRFKNRQIFIDVMIEASNEKQYAKNEKTTD